MGRGDLCLDLPVPLLCQDNTQELHVPKGPCALLESGAVLREAGSWLWDL